MELKKENASEEDSNREATDSNKSSNSINNSSSINNNSSINTNSSSYAIPIPTVAVKEVVDRTKNRRKQFNRNRRGFLSQQTKKLKPQMGESGGMMSMSLPPPPAPIIGSLPEPMGMIGEEMPLLTLPPPVSNSRSIVQESKPIDSSRPHLKKLASSCPTTVDFFNHFRQDQEVDSRHTGEKMQLLGNEKNMTLSAGMKNMRISVGADEGVEDDVILEEDEDHGVFHFEQN